MASLDTPVTHLKHREGMMTDRKCPNSRPRQHAQDCSYYLRWALSVPSQEAGAPSVFLHACFTSGLFCSCCESSPLLASKDRLRLAKSRWQSFASSGRSGKILRLYAQLPFTDRIAVPQYLSLSPTKRQTMRVLARRLALGALSIFLSEAAKATWGRVSPGREEEPGQLSSFLQAYFEGCSLFGGPLALL